MSGRLLFFTHLCVLFLLCLEMLVVVLYLNQWGLWDWSLPAVLMGQMFKMLVVWSVRLAAEYLCVFLAAGNAARLKPIELTSHSRLLQSGRHMTKTKLLSIFCCKLFPSHTETVPQQLLLLLILMHLKCDHQSPQTLQLCQAYCSLECCSFT